MTLLIFIIILVVLPLAWPYIKRWIARYAAGKLEDRMRSMMGMPTRAQEKKEAKRRAREQRQEDPSASARSAWHERFARKRGRRHPVDPSRQALRMMKSYAEDVEYVEIRDYSASMILSQDPNGEISVVLEEQLSEAEYQIIA